MLDYKRCADGSYNFVCPSVIECRWVRDELFQEADGDIFLPLPIEWKVEDLAIAIGFMPSKGQARKNGFCGEIPDGFNDYMWGKNRLRIYTYRPPLKIMSLVNRVKITSRK